MGDADPDVVAEATSLGLGPPHPKDSRQGSVAVDSHNERVAELGLAALAGLKAGATREQHQDTLERLTESLHRVDDCQLDSADWSFIRALVWNQVARAEGRQAHVIAKLGRQRRQPEAMARRTKASKGHDRNGAGAYRQAQHRP